jgi:hypothetical protein
MKSDPIWGYFLGYPKKIYSDTPNMPLPAGTVELLAFLDANRMVIPKESPCP